MTTQTDNSLSRQKTLMTGHKPTGTPRPAKNNRKTRNTETKCDYIGEKKTNSPVQSSGLAA
ncbi:MAG TPA: hypothetical protein PLY78_12200 [Methanospirillum sp.]|nr:hypothetical protein [Methanospirillum sp.]